MLLRPLQRRQQEWTARGSERSCWPRRGHGSLRRARSPPSRLSPDVRASQSLRLASVAAGLSRAGYRGSDSGRPPAPGRFARRLDGRPLAAQLGRAAPCRRKGRLKPRLKAWAVSRPETDVVPCQFPCLLGKRDRNAHFRFGRAGPHLKGSRPISGGWRATRTGGPAPNGRET